MSGVHEPPPERQPSITSPMTRGKTREMLLLAVSSTKPPASRHRSGQRKERTRAAESAVERGSMSGIAVAVGRAELLAPFVPAEPVVEVLAALVAAAAVAVAGVLLQRRRRCESARDGSPRWQWHLLTALAARRRRSMAAASSSTLPPEAATR